MINLLKAGHSSNVYQLFARVTAWTKRKLQKREAPTQNSDDEVDINEFEDNQTETTPEAPTSETNEEVYVADDAQDAQNER